MHWASFDPFLIGDAFWQDKMGMPVANRQFLEAFLRYGRFTSCRFFCQDTVQTEHMGRFLSTLTRGLGTSVQPCAVPQALAWEHLRREPVDVMHHGDFTFYMPYVMEWRNRAAGVLPFAATGVTHSLDTLSIYSKCLNLLIARPKPYDAVVCTSLCAETMLRRTFEDLRERFKEAFHADLPEPPRLVRIPLGIPDPPDPPVPREAARRRLGWNVDDVIVLYVGRFSVRGKMDLSPFLEGAAWFLKKFRREGRAVPCRFVLAGAGKREDVRLVSELCRCVGLSSEVTVEANLTSEKKNLFYAASDVFCSLVDNFQETFGLTILEAMSFGLPVIASAFNGYRDLVRPGVSGFLIPTYASPEAEPWESLAGILDVSVLRYHRAQKVAFDMESFLDALTVLVTRPEMRRSMGEAARREAQRYRWPRIIAEYTGLWEELAREARMDRTRDSAKEPSLPVLTPRFESIFGHYPSHGLHEETWLTVGPYGRERLAEGFMPVIYGESAPMVCQDVLGLIRGLDFSGGRRLGEIVSTVQQCLSVSRETAYIHVDWLLKHGILRPTKS